jgi:arabinogalactan endo-1,4-beta-galactosidase
MRRFSLLQPLILAGLLSNLSAFAASTAPPTEVYPIDGETYYLTNQMSGLQVDLDQHSPGADQVIQNTRSFTSLSQRWAMTKIKNGSWKISNLQSGLCLESDSSIVQRHCTVNAVAQEWLFIYATNGYYAIKNAATGHALEVPNLSKDAGANLGDAILSNRLAQNQLWHLRPTFFRGDDNAELGKQEADRTAVGDAFWNDAGQVEDPLQIMRNHGFNLLRVRPTPLTVPNSSTPLYKTYTLSNSTVLPATCTGNGCHAETDAADLALAKRAKQLGMSVQLSLFFDGASSVASPDAWNGYSTSQVEQAVYNYVKAEIEEYRAAGAMPDIVAIGNEVDTGFLGTGVSPAASGSPRGAYNGPAFTNFSNYQKQGMQAVLDAAADPALGPAIPPPLRCIHITPGWDLTSFFTEVNQNNVPYEAICQSYYPFYHGPLTTAQAAACNNPVSYHVEQTALVNAANVIGKPIYLTEIGEHYEDGNAGNDCWYPATRAGQRQFVLDVQSVLRDLPNNLAMGLDWWNGTGTNVYTKTGAYANNYNPGETDALFAWGGLTLFDDNDAGTGIDDFSGSNYDTTLPALDAMGGKLDPTLNYKLVNVADGRVLQFMPSGLLSTERDEGILPLKQQWRISGNNSGYFQISSAAASPNDTIHALDNQGSYSPGTPVVANSANGAVSSQEWNVMTTGNGNFAIINNLSGLVLASAGSDADANATIQQQDPSSVGINFAVPASKAQEWQIIPVYITQE